MSREVRIAQAFKKGLPRTHPKLLPCPITPLSIEKYEMYVIRGPSCSRTVPTSPFYVQIISTAGLDFVGGASRFKDQIR